MSTTRSERNRHRVLEAATSLIVERGYHGVGLDTVAEAAQVSRQTVYNLFGSKAGLLAAMVAYTEESAGLPRLLQGVRSAADGRSMLHAMLDTHVIIEPQIRPQTRVIYAARVLDSAAADLWQNRMDSRYAGYTRVIERLRADGALRAGLSVAQAADIMWSLLSVHHYEYLVVERGWSIEQYRTHLAALLDATILEPEAAVATDSTAVQQPE